MKRRRTWSIVFVALCALPGCGGSAPSLPHVPDYDANAGVVRNALPADDPAPRRLLTDLTEPASAPLRFDGATDLQAPWVIPAPILARDYSLLRFRARTAAATYIRFSWRSDLEPDGAANPGLSWRPIGDGAWHTYELPLNPTTAPTWAGETTDLAFLSDAAVEVEFAELAWQTSSAVRRVTVGTRTHEGFPGNPPAWVVTVPESAVFEAHVALTSRTHADSDERGVRYAVELEDATGRAESLAFGDIAPDDKGWKTIRADLAAYAGQTVTIRLQAFPWGSRAGFYTYWGNPIVFGSAPRDGTPVVLISTDTLRFDHLPMYGYDRDTAPTLAAFAGEAVVFDNAYTQDAWTLPSHTSMLTGLYPKHHDADQVSLTPDSVTYLPEILADHGYVSGGWSGISAWFDAWRGFSRGFDWYEHPAKLGPIFTTRPKVEEWITGHAANPLFVFFHNYDVHSKSHEDEKFDAAGNQLDEKYLLPYDPGIAGYDSFSKAIIPKPEFSLPATSFLTAHNLGKLRVTADEHVYLQALYDDCIRMVDDNLGQLFQKLKDLGLYDRALVILTSDHGEAFGEHGLYLHGEAYETQTRIPLLVRFPQGEMGGRRIDDLVQLTDLTPTILDVLGIESGVPFDGRSLYALAQGTGTPAEFAYSQRFATYAVRQGPWKLYDVRSENRQELYNVEEDPGEEQNRAGEAPAQLGPLTDELNRFYDKPGPGWHIDIQAGAEKLAVDFSFTATEPLTCARILEMEEFLWPGLNDVFIVDQPLRMTGKGQVRGAAGDRDRLVFHTEDGAGALQFSWESDTPVRLVVGGEAPVESTGGHLLLDATAGAVPPEFSAEAPAIYVWYQPADAGR